MVPIEPIEVRLDVWPLKHFEGWTLFPQTQSYLKHMKVIPQTFQIHFLLKTISLFKDHLKSPESTGLGLFLHPTYNYGACLVCQVLDRDW